MKLEIVIRTPGQKDLKRTTEISDSFSMAQMKQLWEAEQFLNSIPGSNLRFHINLTE